MTAHDAPAHQPTQSEGRASTPAVDADRLWRSLEEISTFGATPAGGIHRLAGSAADGQARDYLVAAARELGCSVRIDPLGNTFLRRPGSVPRARAILIGSHLDSQPMAGRYDGTYGVMAGLEVLRALDVAGVVSAHPVEVVCWTNEEGARFPPAMMGSAYFAGALAREDLLARRDRDGVSLGEGLREIGYAGPEAVSPTEHLCYLEAHIEQGPVLQDEGIDIGVVTGVQGMRWFAVELTGQPGHSGTSPMESRRDALVAAAELVTAVHRIGRAEPGVGRATVGALTVTPNSPNVVPGRVDLMVEFRHPEVARLAAMTTALERAATGVSAATGVEIRMRPELDSPPVLFDPAVVAAVEAAAVRTGHSTRRIVSGAGHDACLTAPLMPTGMIFVPCEQGISHAEAEAITAQWAADGAQVLLETVLALDAGTT